MGNIKNPITVSRDGKLKGPRTPLELSWPLLIYLVDSLKTNPSKICSPLSEKASKGRYFGLNKLQNQAHEGKRKEEKKDRGGRK